MMTLNEFKEKCKRCGDCLDVCSQYSDIEMIDSLIDSIESGTESKYDISKCLTCGFCEAACPEGLSLKLLIKEARLNQISKEGFSDINFLCDPYSDRNIFRFASEMEEPLLFEAREAETVYFPGCYSTYFHKTMVQAIIRLLEMAEIDFAVLDGVDYCCGVVPAGTGNPSVVKKNGPVIIEKLREMGAKTVITSCPGCFMALSRVYPSLFGELDLEIVHASQYLLDLVDRGILKPGDRIGGEVFYHDPCHLTRGSGIYVEPRKLLDNMEGTELMNPEPSDSTCCGFGGGVRMNHPSESISISRREHEEIQKRGAKAIITNCAGCRQNLLEGRPEEGPMVYDLAEYLLLSMGESVPRDDESLIELVNATYEKGMRDYRRPCIDP